SSICKHATAAISVIVYLLFFFASRRRDTRSKRDWSSDVCSSNLTYSREGIDKKMTLIGGDKDDYVVQILKTGALTKEQPWFMSRSEEHTSELQSRFDLVCRLLLEKKNIKKYN